MALERSSVAWSTRRRHRVARSHPAPGGDAVLDREPDGAISDRCIAFSEAMIAGGLKCPVEAKIRDDIWIKLMGNVAFNPISALTRGTMVEICQHSGTGRWSSR